MCCFPMCGRLPSLALRTLFFWKTPFPSSPDTLTLRVLFSVLAQETAQAFFTNVKAWVIADAGWFYLLTVGIVLALVVFLSVSRYGDIKLGKDHSEPEYSYTSWFAMLFSAGMGIGLMFWSVAEPVGYFTDWAGSPLNVAANTPEAKDLALGAVMYHWGLHPWAIYGVVALSLAFFAYTKDMPLTMRSAFYPILGERCWGWAGHLIDTLAVLATIFGLATSLGLGARQAAGGLHFLFGTPNELNVQIAIVVGVTAVATMSVVRGLDGGVKLLSNLNMGLAVLLLLFVMVTGPTLLIFTSMGQTAVDYATNILPLSNWFGREDTDFLHGWTVFYWAWWISWSPFVGMFIARVSRGRTIREFALGVMLVPAGFTLFWMTVFGDTAIQMILDGSYTELAAQVKDSEAVALFHFLEQFPFSTFISGVATLMVVVFFVTSSDSGSMVVDMLASGSHDDTPVWQRIFWASTEGFVAIALMFAGGLKALQAATIASALPFAAVLLVSCYGLLRSLRVEGIRKVSFQANLGTAPAAAVHVGHTPPSGGWKARLRGMVNFPTRAKVLTFLNEVATPALNAVADELRGHGLEVDVREGDDRATLVVSHGQEIDFSYGVRVRGYARPSITMRQLDHSKRQAERDQYFRADVFLSEGGQDYDLMGYTREQVISDVLDQYEKHMHFLHMLR